MLTFPLLDGVAELAVRLGDVDRTNGVYDTVRILGPGHFIVFTAGIMGIHDDVVADLVIDLVENFLANSMHLRIPHVKEDRDGVTVSTGRCLRSGEEEVPVDVYEVKVISDSVNIEDSLARFLGQRIPFRAMVNYTRFAVFVNNF